jgi:hypothetical protein
MLSNYHFNILANLEMTQTSNEHLLCNFMLGSQVTTKNFEV